MEKSIRSRREVYDNRPPRWKVSEDTKKMKMPEVINISHVDYTLFIVVVLLVLLGIVMVFSSSYYVASTAKYNYDTFLFLRKHAMFAAVGFFAMFFMINFNYRYIKRFAFPLYIVANILLVVVLFTEEINGARRWIVLPVIGNFQPSEVGKAAVIFFISMIIANNKNILKKWPGFLFVCSLVGIPFVLVALGNMSTSIIVAIIGFGIIFIASPYIMRFVMAGASAVTVLVLYLAVFSNNFRSGRWDAWLDPFSDPLVYGYQTIQSLYAIASGGIFGLGLGQSRQKLGFIPEAHNDIIFSIICEELGFFGAAIVLILFGVLIWRGLRIAMNAPDLFGSLLAAGIVILMGSQAVINIAVVTGSIPNTGVPLPFISYGGTSLMVNLFLMGVLLNISRYSKDTAG